MKKEPAGMESLLNMNLYKRTSLDVVLREDREGRLKSFKSRG